MAPMVHDPRPIWCPYCEKVTDHRLLILRTEADERLEPADPPLGSKHAVTCLSCRLVHSWWARRLSS